MATTSFQASHMRFWFGSVYARACRLTGRIDECVKSAQQLAESSREIPGLAYANLAFLMGNRRPDPRDLPNSAKLLHEALAGVEKHAVTTGLRPATSFALAEAHAKLGQPDGATAALTEARQSVPADYVFMQTGLSLATGWTLAAERLTGRSRRRGARSRHGCTEARSAHSRIGMSAGVVPVGRCVGSHPRT